MTERPGITRRHVCPHCGGGFATVEMTVAEYHEMRQSPKASTAKPAVKVVERIRTKKMTRRARLFLSRGVDVPNGMEADWKTLKTSGMSNAEAAASLGLPHFRGSEIVD